MKTVLIVEDDEEMASLLVTKIKGASYNPVLLKDGWETLVYLLGEKKEHPVAMVLDLMLPGRTGHELLNVIRSVLPHIKIFIFSSHEAGFSTIPKYCVEGFFIKANGVNALVQAMDQSCADLKTA